MCLNRFSVRLLMFLVVICTNLLHSQQVLLSGTSFDPIVSSDTSRFYWGIGEIQYYGLQSGGIVMTTPIAPNVNTNVFNNDHYYAVTNNPNKLDRKRYTNLVGTNRDNQLVISKIPSDGANLFVYNVSNAQAYTDVKVVIDYCYVKSYNLGVCGNGYGANGLKVAVNPSSGQQIYGDGTSWVSSTTFCKKDSIQAIGNPSNGGAVLKVGADGNISVFVNNQGTTNDTCKIVGIKKIEIFGTPKPKLKTGEAEVCTKELINLEFQSIYTSATYMWQVSVNGGAFADIGTNVTATYEPQADGNYRFRAMMTSGGKTYVSDTISVVSVKCCEENGQPASRKDLFIDDFGRSNSADNTGLTYYVTDYTNITNPVEVLKTTTTAYRWPAVPPPSGLTYEPTFGNAPNDGFYIIGSNLTNSTVNYANNITGLAVAPNQGYDHSGTKEGGVLLMNLTPSTKGNTLYNRTFNNLCTGKQVFFEAYATVFTNDNGVSIRTEITDLNSGTVLKDSIIVNSVKNGPANTTGWRKISGTLTLTGVNPALNFKIINNNPTTSTSGNDLALDDIKIKVCGPPSLEAYFDTVSSAKNILVCDLKSVDVFAKPSSLLRNFYGNTQLFLWQWSKTPDVLSSWKNIGSPIADTKLLDIGTVASDPALTSATPTGPIYFRIIAATPLLYATTNNFQDIGEYANANDPCSNYTVSDEIVLDISCITPVSWLKFEGESTSLGNRLTWVTANSGINNGFVVQKSLDGYTFFDVGNVTKPSIVTQTKTFIYYDEQSNSAFYRLKQNESYSKSIYVNSQEGFVEKLYVIPNPNNGEFKVQSSVDFVNSKVDVYSIDGKNASCVVVLNETDNSFKIHTLKKGYYLIKITNEEVVLTEKIIVE